MTPEEKAERYDELAKEVKDFFEGKQKMYSDITQTLEYLFPELKEDDDEKIRKALICGMHTLKEQHKTCFASIPIDNVIAWLEKQGEQKLNGTFVNVDDVREDFIDEVYRVLNADSTNDRANQIIDAFDSLPTVTIKQDPCKHCKMTYSTCYSFPCDEKKAFEQGKSALEAINEEKVDNQYCVKPVDKVEPKDYSSIDPHFFKPTDKIVEKYNITGIGSKNAQGKLGEMIKNLKSINERLEQKITSSKEDETSIAVNNPDAYKIGFADGEAHAKEEQWKPSDEQIKHLTYVVYDAKHKNRISTNGYEPYSYLYALLMQLKKLKG